MFVLVRHLCGLPTQTTYSSVWGFPDTTGMTRELGYKSVKGILFLCLGKVKRAMKSFFPVHFFMDLQHPDKTGLMPTLDSKLVKSRANFLPALGTRFSN